MSYDFNPFDTRPVSQRSDYIPAPVSRGPINARSSEDHGVLQDLVDTLFARRETATRLDLVCLAEAHDLSADLMEVVELMPPGTYTRMRLADQMNSILTAHGWGATYGTVE